MKTPKPLFNIATGVLLAGLITSVAIPSAHAAAGGYDDHQNMMDQLGITKLRPGKSGSAQTGPGFDLAMANPWKDTMPDALTMKDGTKVTTAAQWPARRAEILEDFEREVYGRVPQNVPTVAWTVTQTVKTVVGGIPVVGKQLVGHVDNASYPALDVNISLTLVTPANAKGPVPVLMMFGGGGLPPAPVPNADEMGVINRALKKMLTDADPSLGAVFQQNLAYNPIPVPPGAGRGGIGGAPAGGDPPATQQLLAAGWGYAGLNPASIQADAGGNALRQGIIGLVNKGEPRKPDDWGALRAWAWGAARGLDYLETDPAVDAKHVGIEGVSRYGKAAVVTLAFEPRFAMALIGSSGEGGVKLHRHDFGEAVENLTGGEYYWMAGNFLKYGATEPFVKTAGDIPVDSHELLALCAPRLAFVSYGVESAGDPKWVDAPGSFMAAVLATPVYRLLGKNGLDTPGNYITDAMPPVGTLIGGELAFRQHEGGHTDAPNVKYFIQWADKLIGHTPPAPTP